MREPCPQAAPSLPDTGWDLSAWYDRNAAGFAARTVDLGLRPEHDRFLRLMSPGARILDAGCGAGRDARAFLDRGYRVGAFDASAAMVAATRAATGGRVEPRHLTFAEYADPPGSWDGIWAMASLLHLPPAELAPAIAALLRSMTPTGVLFLSFKQGQGPRRDADGRLFTDLDAAGLEHLIRRAAPDARMLAITTDAGLSSGREATIWVSAMVRGA